MSDSPATTKPRRTGTIDTDKRVVTITEPNGATQEHRLNDLSADVQTKAALIGLRYLLIAGDGETWSKLVDGDVPMRKPAATKVDKEKPLPSWKLAGAHYHADQLAKAAGVRPSPGKKLHDMPAYAPHLETAKGRVADWTPAEVNTAKNVPGIRDHYNRITGTAPDVDKLFAAAAEPALAEAAD